MYDFGYMMADMAEKQLAAENTAAKAAVDARNDLQYLENELAKCQQELARVNQELERTRKETMESSASSDRMSRRSFFISVIACLFTAAGIIYQILFAK